MNSYGISNAFDRTESDALFEDKDTCSSDEFLGFAVSGLKMIKVFVTEHNVFPLYSLNVLVHIQL